MKKLLALVLALVMTLGLATVATNAAYSDESEIDFNEAVSVMSALGVFQGSDGKFSPKAKLDRETAAKLVAYLDVGEKTAESFPGVKVFSDVEASRWSAKYIAYCADAGYIAGNGGGKYLPSMELTGYAFGKMLLTVLGYDAQIESLVGSNWSIAVARLMQNNGIADGVAGSASAVLTREQAAQYCLNALKATMVEYQDKGVTVKANGVEVTTSASKYNEVSNKNKEEGIENDDLMQLGEKLYPELVLNEETDDFGRPASTWTYDGDDVCTASQKADASYTGTVKGSKVYKDLGKKEHKAGTFTYYENGVEKTAPADIYKNENDTFGALNATVEFFKDKNDVTGVMIQYKVGTVSKVNAEKTDKDGEVTSERSIVIDGKKFETASFKKDDVVNYALVDGEIKDVKLAKTIEGKVSSMRKSKATISGTSYDVLDGVDVKSGSEGTFYLGVDDSIVKFKGENTSGDKFAVVYNWTEKEGDPNSDGYRPTVTTAYLVLEDGSKKAYEVNKSDADTIKDSVDKVICYTISNNKLKIAGNDDEEATDFMSTTIGKGHREVNDKIANSSTKFVFYDWKDDKQETMKVSVTTGYNNVAEQTGNAAVVYDKDSNKAITVFVNKKAAPLSSDENIAVLLDVAPVETEDGDDTIYTYSVAIKGETKELKMKNEELPESFDAGTIFTYSTDEGYATDPAVKGTFQVTVTSVEDDEYITYGSGSIYDLNKDCATYLIDGDLDSVEVNTDTVEEGDVIRFYTVGGSGEDKDEILAIYILSEDYQAELK